MADAKHTPGPFFVGVEAASMAHNGDVGIVNAKGGVVAVALDRNGEALQTARCLAEAPAMLTLLELAVARIELANAEGDPILAAWLPDARTAIAKATGSAS